MAAAFALLYLAFPTRKFYWDGVSFALAIENAKRWRELFNVHHLLYNFIGYGAYHLLGASVRSLYLMQAINAVAGGVFVWLAYRVFRSLDVPPANSVAFAALTGAAATFWRFTTDADSYIIANIFLAAAWLTIRRRTPAGALFHAGAMMMHQLSALFFPVALALLWQRARDRFWREAAIYTAVTIGATLAIYRAAFALVPDPEAPTFAGWLTFHAKVPFFFKLVSNAGYSLLGTLRLIGGGKLSATAWVVGPVVLALLVIAISRLVRERGRFQSVRAAWPLAVWLGTYLLFLFVWEPYNVFYRLFYLLPLVALAAVATRAMSARPFTFLVAALAIWNFAQMIVPYSRTESNPPLQSALEQQKQWPPGTGVIYGDFVTDLWPIRYFNPQVTWIEIKQPEPARVSFLAAEFAREGHVLYVDWTYRQICGEPAPRFTFRAVTPDR